MFKYKALAISLVLFTSGPVIADQMLCNAKGENGILYISSLFDETQVAPTPWERKFAKERWEAVLAAKDFSYESASCDRYKGYESQRVGNFENAYGEMIEVRELSGLPQNWWRSDSGRNDSGSKSLTNGLVVREGPSEASRIAVKKAQKDSTDSAERDAAGRARAKKDAAKRDSDLRSHEAEYAKARARAKVDAEACRKGLGCEVSPQ